MTEPFAVRLLRAQSAAGLRSCDLAKKAGIRRSVLSQLERGMFNPSYKTLISLHHALGVSIDWLCGVTDEQRP